jgi:hypothetical protein
MHLRSPLWQAAAAFAVAFLVVNLAFAQARPPAPYPAPPPPDQEGYAPKVNQGGKDVVWVPTPHALVKLLLDMAQVTDKDILYDLGSGDGRMVISAAGRGARAHGIEYNPDLVALARRNAARAGVADKATFEQADIFNSDFSKASVIMLFLLPDLNIKLRPTLLNMKPGTRIVANAFDMREWQPDKTGRADQSCKSWCTGYMWVVPAKVQGNWKTAHGELSIRQEYQKISGTLRTGHKSVAISDGKMNGELIRFNAGSELYSGRVNGDSIEGTITRGGEKSEWRATRGK